MKFVTPYSQTLRRSCSSGSQFRTVYVRKVDDSGRKSLVKSHEECLYDSIQKAAVGISLEDLIKRSQRGDTSAIGSTDHIKGEFDLTGAPRDLLEAHTILSNAKTAFNNLSADIKVQYGNDFSTFLASVSHPKEVITTQKEDTSNA